MSTRDLYLSTHLSFHSLLNQHLPNLGPQQLSQILDAAAIAAYHAQTGFPIVELLIGDDAPHGTSASYWSIEAIRPNKNQASAGAPR